MDTVNTKLVIDRDLHTELKIEAAKQHKTLQVLLNEILLSYLQREK